jgi:hypothetical protein
VPVIWPRAASYLADPSRPTKASPTGLRVFRNEVATERCSEGLPKIGSDNDPDRSGWMSWQGAMIAKRYKANSPSLPCHRCAVDDLRVRQEDPGCMT